MKFTASNALSPSLSLVINKGIRVILGGTEEPFGVQGENPICLSLTEINWSNPLVHLPFYRLGSKV